MPEHFGAALAPALIDASQGRLSELHWFRTDWQRGGALTGYATWNDGTSRRPVVVKLPVPPQELTWLSRLQSGQHDCGQVVPELLASGRELGGYDLAWVIMQRMRYGPLDSTWNGQEVPLLLDAAGRFHAAMRQYPIDAPPRREDWDQTLRRSRQVVHDGAVVQTQRWTQALRALHKKADKLLETWSRRPMDDWCHGDFHLGNAMTDAPPPAGPAVLFDLAMVHPGHWVEDAVYLEHLFWSRPQRLHGLDVVKGLSITRKAHGLKGDSAWPRLAAMRRVLLAAAVPAQQSHRPDPAQLQAALVMLEQSLPQI